MMLRYYGNTECPTTCPLQGNCNYKGIQCNKITECTWLTYENAVRGNKSDLQ